MSEIKKEITEEATVEKTVAEAADVKVVADAKPASPDPVDNPDDALAAMIKKYGGNWKPKAGPWLLYGSAS